MSEPILTFPWNREQDPEFLRTREWLVTNGLGGYASGTLLGIGTRRYHSHFVPNLPKWGRTVILPRLDEEVHLPDRTVLLGGAESADERLEGENHRYLKEFLLEWMVPTWRFDLGGGILEKRIIMPYSQNTVYVVYRFEGKRPIRMSLRPYITFRGHDGPLRDDLKWPIPVKIYQGHCEFRPVEEAPSLRLCVRPKGQAFTFQEKSSGPLLYRVERERGHDSLTELYSPGYYELELFPGEPSALVASTERWEMLDPLPAAIFEAERSRHEKLLSLAPPVARSGMRAQLVLAADQFIVLPGSRLGEDVLARASGDQARTVIAGYHWFTDWGRDTMISLEGLTLCTGRHREAGAILRTFSHYLKDGLLPNLFPEGHRTALYHTVDATFWYFHAIDRYQRATGDQETLKALFPALKSVIEHHLKGTHFGIGVDPKDGLIHEGAPGLQLTWMDAKVGDWVVTPRRGKPVEIQALWYNALRLMALWANEMGEPSQEYADLADRAYQSFNARFWYEPGRYLYDVIDGENGDDPSLRPNQIFAISLRFPVLVKERWQPVMDIVAERLLTPVGLRTLDPAHKDYQPRYFGDLRARDAAYHQGTVWAWLIGPFFDAWRKVYGEGPRTEALLKAFEGRLYDNGVGTISEIFDAEPPHTGRGCIAQAWSVAEVLRAMMESKTPNGLPPPKE
ncbi:MAG: glycogen debranching protein [Candidatus Manganitrophaceae bacterium]|nr:MAG: glycogen debranching protein [Candidatus Manganitrophaceae bacterium]